MKLAISLLVLMAFGQAASRLTTDGTYVSTPGIKRELLEGNFGDRTPTLHRFGASDAVAVPGIQYAADFKQSLEDQLSPHNQIFGARLPQISKISDLLTGQGPSFEVALANHLYSPVSVYNTKTTEPGLFQVTFPEKNKKERTTPKPSKAKKSKENFSFLDVSSLKPNPFYQADSTQSPHFGSKHRQTLLPSSLSIGEETRLLKKHFSQTKVPAHLFLEIDDKPSPFKYEYKQSTQTPALQYYSPQDFQYSRAPSYEYFNQYERPDGKVNQKKEKLLQFETTRTPEHQEQASILNHAYHSHPNGAVSYASYTSNQGPTEGQPKYQLQYEQAPNTQYPTYAPQARQQQPIYVPEFVYTSEQPAAEKQSQSQPQQQYVAVPQQQYVQVPQQQYVQFPQQQYVQQPYVQQSSPAEKPADTQYVAIPQSQYNELYLNPARHQLLQEIQQGAAPPNVQYQQQYYVPSASPQPETAAHPATPTPQNYQTAQPAPAQDTNQLRFRDQPPQQEVVHILPQQRYTPAPAIYGQSLTPYNPPATPSAPQYPVTQNAEPKGDQRLQATTIQPELLHENAGESLAHPRSISQQSSTPYASQPTLQPLHASPESLQSLTTVQPSAYQSSTPQPQHTHYYTPQHHEVQIQQQQFQEIHSELRPLVQTHQHNKPVPQSHGHHYASTTPQPSTHQSSTTPQPTSSTKADYEIEISSNVDHSQLPKDLRPVQQQGESQPQPEHSNPQEHSQQQPTHTANTQTHEENRQAQAKDAQQVEPTQTHEEHTQSGVEQSHQESHPQQEQNQQQVHQYQQQIVLSHPHSIPHPPQFAFYDPNLAHLTPVHNPLLHPTQPVIQPRLYSNGQQFVLPPHLQEPQPPVPAPTFAPVQFFGKFAQALFGGPTSKK